MLKQFNWNLPIANIKTSMSGSSLTSVGYPSYNTDIGRVGLLQVKGTRRCFENCELKSSRRHQQPMYPFTTEQLSHYC